MRRLAMSDIAKFLEQPKWASHDLVDHSAPLRNPPTLPTLQKLARLAGLAEPDPSVLGAFHNQLRFVETLADVNTEGIQPVVRLVAPHPVKLQDETAPKVESWVPTSVAAEKAGDFYVVKEGLSHEESRG